MDKLVVICIKCGDYFPAEEMLTVHAEVIRHPSYICQICYGVLPATDEFETKLYIIKDECQEV